MLILTGHEKLFIVGLLVDNPALYLRDARCLMSVALWFLNRQFAGLYIGMDYKINIKISSWYKIRKTEGVKLVYSCKKGIKMATGEDGGL